MTRPPWLPRGTSGIIGSVGLVSELDDELELVERLQRAVDGAPSLERRVLVKVKRPHLIGEAA